MSSTREWGKGALPAPFETRFRGSPEEILREIELKLASGISHQLRYRDLGDVVALLDSVRLPREFGDKLNPYVQPKWFEIWDAWSVDPQRDKF